MANPKNDVGAGKLYVAERNVDWAKYGADEMLPDLKDVWVYCTKLINRKSFAKRYPKTHQRFAIDGELNPIAFPKAVMANWKNEYYTNEDYPTYYNLGGIAGGGDPQVMSTSEYAEEKAVVSGIRSPDVYELKKSWKGDKLATSYRPRGLRIYPAKKNGAATKDMITLCHWARQKWVILHELAHVIDWNENGAPTKSYHMGHGWQFCQIYIHIVGMAFGHDAKTELRQALKANGVQDLQPKSEKEVPYIGIEWTV
jgi:hypothetical protein